MRALPGLRPAKRPAAQAGKPLFDGRRACLWHSLRPPCRARCRVENRFTRLRHKSARGSAGLRPQQLTDAGAS